MNELCGLVGKIEKLAKKAVENESDRKGAIALLERIGKELKNKSVLAKAQEKEKAGKRLKRLEKHECQGLASTANRVLGEIVKRFKNEERVAQGVAKFKETKGAKPVEDKVKVKVTEHPKVEREQEKAAAALVAKGDPFTNARQVVKKALVEGLKLACEETGKDVELAEKVATELEEELSQKYNTENKVSKEYKLKYRSLSFNLKDKNNPDLRSRVLLGEVDCKDLVTWSPQQLASDKRKEDNATIKKNMLLNAQARKPTVSSTDQFKCGKCGQRKCTYYQMQTRSADEPMTTFVTCTVCNNRWKFS